MNPENLFRLPDDLHDLMSNISQRDNVRHREQRAP